MNYYPKDPTFSRLIRARLFGKKRVVEEEEVIITGYEWKGVFYITRCEWLVEVL